MIVGSRLEDLEIPHEPNNFIKVRELSGLELDDAQAISSRKSLRSIMDIDPDMLKALQDARTDTEPAAVPDPKTAYDWEFVITHAIVDWHGPLYDGIVCNTVNKLLLDKKTLEWIVGMIIDRNVVPLEKS